MLWPQLNSKHTNSSPARQVWDPRPAPAWGTRGRLPGSNKPLVTGRKQPGPACLQARGLCVGEAPRGELPGPPADGTETVCGLRVQQPGPILGRSPPHSQQLHPHTTQGTPPAGRMGANAEGTSSSSSVSPPFRHSHARLCSWLVANATQPWPVRGHRKGVGAGARAHRVCSSCSPDSPGTLWSASGAGPVSASRAWGPPSCSPESRLWRERKVRSVGPGEGLAPAPPTGTASTHPWRRACCPLGRGPRHCHRSLRGGSSERRPSLGEVG